MHAMEEGSELTLEEGGASTRHVPSKEAGENGHARTQKNGHHSAAAAHPDGSLTGSDATPQPDLEDVMSGLPSLEDLLPLDEDGERP